MYIYEKKPKRITDILKDYLQFIPSSKRWSRQRELFVKMDTYKCCMVFACGQECNVRREGEWNTLSFELHIPGRNSKELEF